MSIHLTRTQTVALKELSSMDFVEQVFHVSPDGGSGSFELLLLVIPALIVAVYIMTIRIRRA
jgi:hypothetical protein